LQVLASQALHPKKEKYLAEDLQAYCLHDLYFFSKYVLGYWYLCADPHREFCHEIQKDIHLTLYLLPRGHCKTKIFSICHTIQEAIKHPDVPIGLGSDTRQRAARRLREIKAHYKSNTVFRAVFYDKVWKNPENRSECPLWSSDEIHLPGFTMGQEAALTAFGIEAMPTGSHFPRIKFDDLVVPENTTTSDQIKKLKDQYGIVRSSILTTFGNVQICGTIYDDGDLHCEMERSGNYKVYKRPAEETITDPESGIRKRRTLWPVQYGPDQLDAIKKDPMVGIYIYSCLIGSTKILMADWRVKKIREIKVGDAVVGFIMNDGEKSRLVPAKVIAINNRRAKTVKSAMQDGSVITHTPSHQWWTGRRGMDGDRLRRLYSELGPNRGNQQQALCKMIDFNIDHLTIKQKEAALWLAGFFDGEGSISSGTINFTQSETFHPAVCERLRSSLKILDFGWGEWRYPEKNTVTFSLKGGRQEKFRFLEICNIAKRSQVVDGLYNYASRLFGVTKRVKLKSQEQAGKKRVYNIQTETGNYFAEGFASKNCQYLLDPAPEDENAFFQLKWFGRYKKLPRYLKMYAAGDLAISEAETAADTALVVAGLDHDHELWIVHVRFGRWDSLEIIDNILEVQALYKPGIFTLEAENIQRTIMPFLKLKMRETNIFPNITAQLPRGDKISKARPFQGRAREGAIHLPAKGPNQPDWLFDTEFQLRRFPRGRKKDIVDSIGVLCHQLADQWRLPTRQEIIAAEQDQYIPLDAQTAM